MDYMRSPDNGFLSLTLPIKRRTTLSVKVSWADAPQFNAVFELGSVPGEDEITRLDRHVADITATQSDRVDGFSVVELRETPTSA